MRIHSAHQSAAQRVHFLSLLCPSWARVLGILLPLHAARVLRHLASTHVVALPHTSGDLHPLMRYVRLRAAVGVIVPTFPCAAVIREEPNPSR
jgi:hypothetical protein